MKNLILILGDNKYQFDTKEELYNEILGKQQKPYTEFSEEEKANRRQELAFYNAGCNEKFIGSLSDSSEEDIINKKMIFTDTDDVYLLSLLNLGIAQLLEQKDSNIFTKPIDKSQSENYIIVNMFASDLLIEEKKALPQGPAKNFASEIPIMPDFSPGPEDRFIEI